MLVLFNLPQGESRKFAEVFPELAALVRQMEEEFHPWSKQCSATFVMEQSEGQEPSASLKFGDINGKLLCEPFRLDCSRPPQRIHVLFDLRVALTPMQPTRPPAEVVMPSPPPIEEVDLEILEDPPATPVVAA
jgi:hypothetical protein